MSYYTANQKLYESNTGAIDTAGIILAYNSGDVVPDSVVTANSLLTTGKVTLQTGPGLASPQYPVTVIGAPTNGQIPTWSTSVNEWVPGASPAATYVASADGTTFTWNGAPAALGGLIPTATKTANYTATAGQLVPVDTTSGNVTVTLPASPTAGQLVGVCKIDTGGNVVTVAGTIDGQTNASIAYPGSGGMPGATFEYVGGSIGWKIVSHYSGIGPTGPTGPQGPAGGSGVQPNFSTGVVGAWYACSSLVSSSLSNRSVAPGTLICGTPMVMQESVTIDQLACYVQTSNASGLLRLGLYQVTASNPFDVTLGSAWASLLVDTGTTPTSGGAGSVGRVKWTLGSPQVIAAGTAIAVALAVQGTGNTGIYHEGLAASGGFGPTPWGSTDVINGPIGSLTVSSVSGALPATLTPAAWNTSGIGGAGWFHRSA